MEDRGLGIGNILTSAGELAHVWLLPAHLALQSRIKTSSCHCITIYLSQTAWKKNYLMRVLV